MPALPVDPSPYPSAVAHPSPSRHTHSKSSSIYVLSADGSRLFLLDPSAPEQGEHPPAYHTIQSPSSPSTPLRSPVPPDGGEGYDDALIGVEDNPGGPSSPRSVRIQELPPIRSLSSASLAVQASPSRRGEGEGRHRAYTASSASGAGRSGRAMSASVPASERRSGSRTAALRGAPSYADEADEGTPLLGGGPAGGGERKRGMWRSVICGKLDEGEEDMGWGAGWKRFWRPVVRAEYWKSVLHLLVLNFPFALLIWPFLFAGTVAGTALLITLPIGAAVWWLTLVLARTAARLEIMMQTYHHSPSTLHVRQPAYHPIFHRLVESPASSPQTSYRSRSTSHLASPLLEDGPEMVWETGFIKCSYAMFCDFYSYSALSYFVLLKPLITLFSSIALLVLGAVSLGTVLGIPIYLRAARRWGIWQARFAIDNL